MRLAVTLALAWPLAGSAVSRAAAPRAAATPLPADTRLSVHEPAPRPHPRHSAEQVVSFQLAALRENDGLGADAGIATVFAFSSPANQAATGPLARFVALVKSPAYRPLIGHRRAVRAPIRVTGDEATEEVAITSASGEELTYLFSLRRQPAGGAYANCWMTDGVVPVPNADPPGAVRRVVLGGRR